jgi:YD repeat-containing protein
LIKDPKGTEKVEYTYLGLDSGRYLSKLKQINGSISTETHFNLNRQPIKIIAPELTQDIFYDQSGRIVEIKRAGEVIGKVTRDERSGKITEIKDRNQLRKFTYDLHGKISAVDLSDGAKLSFTYNPDGFIKTADLTDVKGLSEGLLTPIYEGETVTQVLIDGKVPASSADQLRAVRFYQVIHEATSLPKY